MKICIAIDADIIFFFKWNDDSICFSLDFHRGNSIKAVLISSYFLVMMVIAWREAPDWKKTHDYPSVKTDLNQFLKHQI